MEKILKIKDAIRLMGRAKDLPVRDFIRLTNYVGIKRRALVFAITSTLLSSGFEIVGISCLIPALKGFMEGSFAEVKTQRYFELIAEYVPQIKNCSDSELFLIFLIPVITASLLKSFFRYQSRQLLSETVRDLCNRLRSTVFSRYLKFGKLYFDSNSQGEIQSALLSQTEVIANEMISIYTLLSDMIMVVAYFIFLVTVSLPLTLLSLLLFPVLHFSIKRLIKAIASNSNILTRSKQDLSKNLTNALNCIPLVKAYSNEEKEQSWFDFTSRRIALLELKRDRYLHIIEPIQENILMLMTLLLMAVVGFLAIQSGSGKAASYLMFFWVLRRASVYMGRFNDFLAAMASSSGAVTLILKILNDRDKYYVQDGTQTFDGEFDLIELRNLAYSFPNNVKALQQVNCKFKRGTMTAIVGSSGSGKSTLANLLIRFYDPPADAILVDGVDIRNFTLTSWRNKIAYVPQEALLLNAPLKINLTYGLSNSISDEEINFAVDRSRLADLVERLPDGLETEIGDRGSKLSGGERQRMAIARAFLKKSEILILDEATSALDSSTEAQIQRSLEELLGGKTSIVIAHRLSTIFKADRVIVMDTGKIVEEGTIKELLEKRGYFYELWQKQHQTEDSHNQS